MNKTYKYTILTLLLAVVFVFGSMEGMNLILRARERQFLSESGSVIVEAPVRAWESWENDKESSMSEDTDSERYILNTRQIEDAINCWNNRTKTILHDPVAGQISMEQAIGAGEKWLIEMNIGEEIDTMSYSINAELGVGGQMEDTGEQLEAYYSFWTVHYSSQSVNAILYINAVTGKVWGAEISLYEELPEKMHDDGLRLFVELAGLQASDDDSVLVEFDSGETIAIKESQLYARKHSYIMSIGFENSYKYTVYQLLIK